MKSTGMWVMTIDKKGKVAEEPFDYVPIASACMGVYKI